MPTLNEDFEAAVRETLAAGFSPEELAQPSLDRKPQESDLAFAVREAEWQIATGRSRIVSLEDEAFDEMMNRVAEEARRVVNGPDLNPP